MRHRRKINHLSRKSAHRKAMMANMASSLILHKRINTTVAKAKALRTYVEPLITKSKLSITTKTSKEEATHLRRVVFSYLQNKEAVTELFREVSAKVVDREGGYTRIIKTGTRLGDNAEMCMMELVDFNENLLAEKGAADSKSKRRRRGARKKGEETQAPKATAAVTETEEALVEETVDQVEETVAEETTAPVEDQAGTAEETPAEAAVEEEPAAEAEEAPVAEVEETPEAKVEEPVQEEAPAAEAEAEPEVEAKDETEAPEEKTDEGEEEEKKDK